MVFLYPLYPHGREVYPERVNLERVYPELVEGKGGKTVGLKKYKTLLEIVGFFIFRTISLYILILAKLTKK